MTVQDVMGKWWDAFDNSPYVFTILYPNSWLRFLFTLHRELQNYNDMDSSDNEFYIVITDV